jgi:hypothetical protein
LSAFKLAGAATRPLPRSDKSPGVFGAVFIVAILSGATATVVGYGIGSLMTPLLGVKFGTTTAVALVTCRTRWQRASAGVCVMPV